MATPVRYPNGVNNATRNSELDDMVSLDPTKVIEYFNDFHSYAAADWVITTTEAGASSATETVSNEVGGALVLTNDTADNDADFLQLSNDGGTTAAEPFKFVAGKKLWFKTRFKLSDVDASSAVIGLQITDTTPLDVTDGVFFLVDDTEADGTVSFLVEKDNTATTATDIATLTDDTYVTLGFYYNGTDGVEYYVNGVHTGTAATTNLPDDEELTVSFGVQNGAAASKVMTIDYVLACQER